MAVYIEITKVSECDSEALYRYETRSGAGKFSVSKSTGEIRVIEQLEGDEQGKLFARAAHKIQRAFEHGELPDREEWAS